MGDFDVLAEMVPLSGRTVVDVGCGDGAFVRQLRAAGADALGVDVSVARALEADPGGRYLEGGAEALPLADASVDVAVLMRSLHHVPDPDAAFPELRRVVRDLVYVAEPLPTGNFFELMLPVDDETVVRAAAQAAIARAAGFERIGSVEYDITIAFDAFEAFRAMLIANDPDRAERFAEVEAHLRERFRSGPYDAPMRADLLRVVSSAA
jgi:SAM-dependent methyltransferase